MVDALIAADRGVAADPVAARRRRRRAPARTSWPAATSARSRASRRGRRRSGSEVSSGWSSACTSPIETLARMPQPVVARVQGAVAGFGLSLMNACDLAIAADDAYFAVGLPADRAHARRRRHVVAAAHRRAAARDGDPAAGRALRRRRRAARSDSSIASCRSPTSTPPSRRSCARSPTARARRSPATKRLVRESLERTLSEQLQAEAVSFGRLRAHRRLRRGHRRVPREAPAAVLAAELRMAGLTGRTLFVTGGSRGIGLAIALRAARDGANVAIAAKTEAPHPKLPGTIHTAAREIEAAGGRGAADRLRHARRRARCSARSRRPSPGSAASTSSSTTRARSASPAPRRRR